MKKMMFALLTTCFIVALQPALAQPNQQKLVYVLLFKWKAGVTEQQLNELQILWNALVQKVNGFESYEMIQLNKGDFEQAVVLEFTSEAAHDTYLQHEDHITLSKKGPRIVDKFLEYNYWK